MKKYSSNQGFIALMFVLGISVTLLTWIGLNSTYVFDYIRARKEFTETRLTLMDMLSCADAFIDRYVRIHSTLWPQNYIFNRKLFLGDTHICHISNIQPPIRFRVDKISVSLFINHRYIADYSIRFEK